MYKEISVNEAIMEAFKGSTVYVITQFNKNKTPDIDPIKDFRLSDLISKDVKHRYIWDEPEPDISVTDARPEADTLAPATEEPKPVTTNHYGPRVDVGKIRALSNAGWSAAKIADEMHISAPTVRKYLGQTEREDISDKIKALLDSGLSDVQIANELDMPRETVLKYLREEDEE